MRNCKLVLLFCKPPQTFFSGAYLTIACLFHIPTNYVLISVHAFQDYFRFRFRFWLFIVFRKPVSETVEGLKICGGLSTYVAVIENNFVEQVFPCKSANICPPRPPILLLVPSTLDRNLVLVVALSSQINQVIFNRFDRAKLFTFRAYIEDLFMIAVGKENNKNQKNQREKHGNLDNFYQLCK